MDALVAAVFRLEDTAALYTTRVEQLATNVTAPFPSTKQNNRIYFPDLGERTQDRDVLLVFNQDLGPACEQAADDGAIYLAKADERC